MKKFKMPVSEKAKKFEINKKPPGKSWEDFQSPEYRRLRSSARWQRLREKILMINPCCHFCGRLANEVHHIESNNFDNFFDVKNLCSVCESCHTKINSALRRGITNDILFAREL